MGITIFIQCLGQCRGNGLTLMSDQHKGLIEVVKDVMPNAEHRQCARHIYENFRKQYPGLEYRQLFWATSKASYPYLFNKIIDKINGANLNAHKYLMDKNLKTWSRAFFEVDRGCEAIENGFSECFNSVIVNVRHKPLLTILEATRVIVLERMNKMRKISRKFWHVIPAGGNLYEVRLGSEGFTVDEGKRTCSCRMWQLSGLPCVHATKVIFLINRVPESYVPTWFETDMYFMAYHKYVKPVPDMNFWPDQSMYSTVLPPKPRKMPGRPRKKRIRAMGEVGSSTRVSKVGSHRSCSNCKKTGHNKLSFKEPVVEQTPKPKGLVGRPRKKQSVDDFEEVDVVQRGPLKDEGASGTRGEHWSRGGGGVAGSRGGASGSIGRGAGGYSGASGSISRGVGGSKRKPVSTTGTQKRQAYACSSSVSFLAALRVLIYLKNASDTGVQFRKGKSFSLHAYSNADEAKCPKTRKFVYGFCLYLCNNIVLWKSKKQATIFRSSVESEYRCLTSTTCELIWVVNFLKDLKVDGLLPTHLYCDSSSAFSIDGNPVFHEKTKHFEIELHLVREKVSSSVVKVLKVSLANNVADIFTKGFDHSSTH
ncbi:multidrug resistance-associated protein 5 [Tanacetum coccineum]